MEKDRFTNMKNQMVADEQMVDRLMKRLSEIEIEETPSNVVRTKQVKWRNYGAAAAVFVIGMVLVWVSPAGETLAEQIKEWMKPKKVIEQVEGLAEESEMTPTFQTDTQTEAQPYVIYVDEEYFTSEYVAEQQIITSIYNEEARMIITHKGEIGIKEYLEEFIKEEGITDYQEENSLDIQRSNMGIWYAEGTEWDDMVYSVFVIDDGKNGCYVAAYCNTVEASEGLGVRFQNMLKTFQLIEDIEE